MLSFQIVFVESFFHFKQAIVLSVKIYYIGGRSVIKIRCLIIAEYLT